MPGPARPPFALNLIMVLYLFWGDDDFALTKAVSALKDKSLDADWASFNFERINADQPEGALAALTQAMTPPFGMGKRFIWLAEPPFLQQASEAVTQELERTLPQLLDSSVLVITGKKKPNGRLKSTKLLQKHGEVKEFSAISPWKTDQITDKVRQAAKEVGVRLTRASGELLVEAVGNNTRQLYNELEKLRLFGSGTVAEGQLDGHAEAEPLDLETVAGLITTSTQSSLQLASAIRMGDTGKALELVADLLGRNEPALRIVATLVGQFRTWLWVRVMTEAGERDEKAIAQAAGIGNPKRIYFLRQEINGLSQPQLLQAMPVLLSLESEIKIGRNPEATLQTKVIELCQICRGRR